MTEGFEQESLSDYSRDEFVAFVRRLVEGPFGTEEEDSRAVGQFNRVVPHPAKSDLIFWPPEGVKLDTPEDVVAEIERWCAQNGEPTFRGG